VFETSEIRDGSDYIVVTFCAQSKRRENFALNYKNRGVTSPCPVGAKEHA